jgi:glucosamine 6-phosphate synthetase-like amidotransferase/phosphosugar isomerase protein
MRIEIAEQPEALGNTFDVLLAQVGELAALGRDTRQVLFIARGSSDNAAVYGQYLCSARAGRLASLASPSLATAYRVVLDLRGVLAVAVSQSGATEEIVTTLEWAHRCGARTVAVTNAAGSPLTEVADLSLITQAGEELAVPATKTYTTQLAAMAVLALSLQEGGSGAELPGRGGAGPAARRGTGMGPEPPGGGGVGVGPEPPGGGGVRVEALRGVPGAVAAMLEVAPAAEALAERLVDVGTLVVSGRGYAYSTALEVALKLKETCYLTAVGLSYADLVHGPIAVVDDDTPALLVAAGDGPILPEMTGLARRIAGTGADVYGIGGDQEFAAACRSALPGPSLPEHLAPFALIVPGQLLVEALARAKGLDPDAPRGLDKVTQTDG